ncbi:MAG: hypothetical protein H7841_11880 [Magnetospirillum sp. WYHS-4]
MKTPFALLALALLCAACSGTTRYEKAVAGYEPVYCYQSLGAVTCYDTPNFRDERRLVNHFGPAPRNYDRPEPKPEVMLHPVNPFPADYQKPGTVKTPERRVSAVAPPQAAEQPAPSAMPVAPVEAEEVDAKEDSNP